MNVIGPLLIGAQKHEWSSIRTPFIMLVLCLFSQLSLISIQAFSFKYEASSVERGPWLKVNNHVQRIKAGSNSAKIQYRSSSDPSPSTSLFRLSDEGILMVKDHERAFRYAIVHDSSIYWLKPEEYSLKHVQDGDLIVIASNIIRSCNNDSKGISIQGRLKKASNMKNALEEANKPCVRFAWLLLRVQKHEYRFGKHFQMHTAQPLYASGWQVLKHLSIHPHLKPAQLRISSFSMAADKRTVEARASFSIDGSKLLLSGGSYLLLSYKQDWEVCLETTLELKDVTQIAIFLYRMGDSEAAVHSVHSLIKNANRLVSEARINLTTIADSMKDMRHYGLVQVTIEKITTAKEEAKD